jgi:hypothetical protein
MKPKMKPISHAPIPKEPWSEIVLAMQEESILLSEQTAELQRREDFLWGILGHYLYKKRWDSKHKIPLRQTPIQREAIEAYGIFWNSLIELAIYCHAYASPSSRMYENASQWVSSIVRESRSLKNSKIAEGTIKKGGKRKFAELLRAKAKLLDEEINPEDRDTLPHTFRLYEDCLGLIENTDVFRKKYWTPHIRALKAHIRQLETNPVWVAQWVEDGKCYEQVGQGRHKNLVLPPKKPLT